MSCKGLVFKATVSNYLTDRGFASTTRLNLLKRKSCAGCKDCTGVWESYREDISEALPINMEDVVHGKLYTLLVTNISRDWETGWVDSWDYKLKELSDED